MFTPSIPKTLCRLLGCASTVCHVQKSKEMSLSPHASRQYKSQQRHPWPALGSRTLLVPEDLGDGGPLPTLSEAAEYSGQDSVEWGLGTGAAWRCSIAPEGLH